MVHIIPSPAPKHERKKSIPPLQGTTRLRFACRRHGRCFKVRCAAPALLLRQRSNPSCVQILTYYRASCKTYLFISRKVRKVRKVILKFKLRVLCELGVSSIQGFCNYFLRTLESIATPCSVKARTPYRSPPRFEVTFWHLKAFTSFGER